MSRTMEARRRPAGAQPRKTRRRATYTLALVVVAGTLVACSGSSDEPPSSGSGEGAGTNGDASPASGTADTTEGATAAGAAECPEYTAQLGVLDSVTGPVAFYGQSAINGMQMALEEAEAADFLGNISVDLQIEDDGSTVEGGLAAYERLVNSDVLAIMGPELGTIADGFVARADEDEIPVVLTTAGAGHLVNPEWVYRTGVSQDKFAHLTVEELANRGVETTAVIWDRGDESLTTVWQDALLPALNEAGIEIVIENDVTGAGSIQDWTPLITGIADADPDAVGIITIGSPNVAITRGLRELGYEGQFWLQTGADLPYFTEEGGDAVEGSIYASSFNAFVEYETGRAFADAYSEEYGDRPGLNASNGYDTMWRVMEALKASCAETREEMKSALDALDGIERSQGAITFLDNGDAEGAGLVIEIQDNTPVPVDG